jgi:hypothetical protein
METPITVFSIRQTPYCPASSTCVNKATSAMAIATRNAATPQPSPTVNHANTATAMPSDQIDLPSVYATAAPTIAPAKVRGCGCAMVQVFADAGTLTSVAPNTLNSAYSLRPPSVSAYAAMAASANLAQ